MATQENRGRRPDPESRTLDEETLWRCWMGGCRSCLAATTAFEQEMLRFWAARLQRDLATGAALWQARDPQTIAKLQSEWAATAMQDYAEQYARLIGLAFDLWRTNAQPFAGLMPTCSEPQKQT